MITSSPRTRSPQRLSACIDTLLEAGGETLYDSPAVLDLLRGRLDSLADQIEADPALVNKRFPELDIGQTGGHNLMLQGATLLHVAAEYGNVAAVALLLDRGADVNAAQQSMSPASAVRPQSSTRSRSSMMGAFR